MAQRDPRRFLGPAAVVIGAALILVGILGIAFKWGSTSTTPAVSTAPLTSTSTPSESPQEYFSSFQAALANGNRTFLFDRLDPVVIASFGAAECQSAVAHLHPLSGERLLAVGPVGAYRFTAGGKTIQVSHVTTFTVQDPTLGVVHYHFALINGRYHYFADCGALNG